MLRWPKGISLQTDCTMSVSGKPQECRKLFTSLPYPNEVTADIVQKTIDKVIVRSKEDVETHFLCEEHFTLLWRLYKETDK